MQTPQTRTELKRPVSQSLDHRLVIVRARLTDDNGDHSEEPSPSRHLPAGGDESKETGKNQTRDICERATQSKEREGDLKFGRFKDGEDESESRRDGGRAEYAADGSEDKVRVFLRQEASASGVGWWSVVTTGCGVWNQRT